MNQRETGTEGRSGDEPRAAAPLVEAQGWSPPLSPSDLGRALEMQVEVLRRIHEQQEQLSETLKDTRRSDMMIQSTRALNESFSGMKRVQESLADRLMEERRRGRAWPWIFGVCGCALLVGIGFAVRHLSDQVQSGAERVLSSRDTGMATLALDEIKGLRDRFETMEGREKDILLSRLATLEGQVQTLEQARLSLAAERDRAQQDLGALRADWTRAVEAKASADAELARLQKEAVASASRLQESEASLARMTKDRLADQQMIASLLSLNGKGEAPGVAATPPAVAPPEERISEDPLRTESEQVVAAPEVPTSPERAIVSAPLLANLNQLLSKHRSSEAYTVVSAGSMDGQALYDVTLEVRGQDGSVAKTVYADRMTITLAPAPQFVELDFEGGHVEYLRGISRRVKSPFFNNRYQIVVLGVESLEWQRAGLPFLKTR